jgi:hypothetical protein
MRISRELPVETENEGRLVNEEVLGNKKLDGRSK